MGRATKADTYDANKRERSTRKNVWMWVWMLMWNLLTKFRRMGNDAHMMCTTMGAQRRQSQAVWSAAIFNRDSIIGWELVGN